MPTEQLRGVPMLIHLRQPLLRWDRVVPDIALPPSALVIDLAEPLEQAT